MSPLESTVVREEERDGVLLVWHKGPPPNIGWWWASYKATVPSNLRWWDGKRWSLPASRRDSSIAATHRANSTTSLTEAEQASVYWRWLPNCPAGVSLLRGLNSH